MVSLLENRCGDDRDSPKQPVILLIQPPFYRLFDDHFSLERYPLSLGYLAAAIRKETPWSVKVYLADFLAGGKRISDLEMHGQGFSNYRQNLDDITIPVWQALEAQIRRLEPDVVGILTLAPTYRSARQTATIVKRCNPATLVMVGGPHPTNVGGSILEDEEAIDLVVRGEGETTVVEVLEAVSRRAPLDGIDGIVFRQGTRIIANAPREPASDLDSLAFPYTSAPEALIDYDSYHPSAFGTVSTSRGCPYACFFCGSRNMWGRTVRTRSVGSVVEEIGALYQSGIRTIMFIDDNLRPSKAGIRELSDRIRETCPDLQWNCYLHVNLIDEPTVEVMARSGCQSIMFGIESGNAGMLERMRKQTSVSEGFAAAEIVRRHRIIPYAFFLAGLPGETEESLMDTFQAMKRFKGELILSVFTPYPGTEAYEYCRAHGLVGEDYDTANFNHQSPLNYFCPDIPRDRLAAIVDEMFRYVERHNAKHTIRRDLSTYLSPDIFFRIHRYGLSNSVKALKSMIEQAF